MKKLICAIAILATQSVYADIPTNQLSPIVRINEHTIIVKDKKGNEYTINTACDIRIEDITEFTIRERMLKNGTRIKLSHDLICRVDSVALV